MAPWQAILSFGVSMFMFGLGYFLGRRRRRVVPGILCRVVDGPEEGKFVGLAEDGTVLMDMRAPAPEPLVDDIALAALRATNENFARAAAELKSRRVLRGSASVPPSLEVVREPSEGGPE